MDVSFWTRFITTKKNTLYNEMSFFDDIQGFESNDSSPKYEQDNKFHNVSNNIKKKVHFSEEKGPIHPNFENIHERLQTFKRLSWPPGLTQKPYDLANAGFFYTGNIAILISKSIT